MTRGDVEHVTDLVDLARQMGVRFHLHHELIDSTSTVLRALLDAPMVFTEAQLSEMVRWGARAIEVLETDTTTEGRNARRMLAMMRSLAAEALCWRTPAGARTC